MNRISSVPFLLIYLSTPFQELSSWVLSRVTLARPLPRLYSETHVVYRVIDERTNNKTSKDRIGIAISKFWINVTRS